MATPVSFDIAVLPGDATGAVEVNRSHRERATRELLAIFDRYRLIQL